MTRGRLVKKAEQEKLGKIQVDSYPWKDFSMETILLPDNPRKSVVLAKSHPEQELNRKVQQPAEFSRTFGNPSKPLFPEDMTSEYLASQEELRQRKRRMQLDEDEAVALELLELDETNVREIRPDNMNIGNNIPAVEAMADAAASFGKSAVRSVGHDISDLSKLSAQNSRGFGDGDLNFTGPQISQEDIDSRIKAAFESGLLQGRADGEKSGYEAALNEMKQIEPPAVLDEDAAARSFAEGVEEGVARGREQALSEAEEKYNHSMALFTKALSELQHLKGELLSTGREIFAEIAQICAERVLRTSVLLNDEALKSVFEAATSQFQSQDELKIEMHPEDISRLEAQIPSEQRKRIRLVANNKLERGDLKIEANNEVISLELHNTVQQVIDSLKDDLFETIKKDETTEKAG